MPTPRPHQGHRCCRAGRVGAPRGRQRLHLGIRLGVARSVGTPADACGRHAGDGEPGTADARRDRRGRGSLPLAWRNDRHRGPQTELGAASAALPRSLHDHWRRSDNHHRPCLHYPWRRLRRRRHRSFPGLVRRLDAGADRRVRRHTRHLRRVGSRGWLDRIRLHDAGRTSPVGTRLPRQYGRLGRRDRERLRRRLASRCEARHRAPPSKVPAAAIWPRHGCAAIFQSASASPSAPGSRDFATTMRTSKRCRTTYKSNAASCRLFRWSSASSVLDGCPSLHLNKFCEGCCESLLDGSLTRETPRFLERGQRLSLESSFDAVLSPSLVGLGCPR